MLALSVLLAASWAIGATARDARAVARAVEAHYRSARTLKVVFLERYRQGRAVLRVESGRAYFSRNGKMRWEYESPEQKLFLVDGKHVWFYVPADHTASRALLKESADWRTPLALLTGKAQLGRLCGRLELADVEGDAVDSDARGSEPGNLVLRCLPRSARRGETVGPTGSAGTSSENDDGAAFREILIDIDPLNQIVRLLIRQPAEVETEIRFGNWEENVPLPGSLFRFEPPRGVAIVDEASLGDWVR